MPVLFNNVANKWEALPEENVNEGVKSGQYAPRRGSRITMLNPEGEQYVVDAAEMQSALNNGWNYLGNTAAKKIAEEQISNIYRQEFDMPATAAAAGALRGFTFGLSDVAMRAIGGKELAAGLETVKEVSPMASAAGEIAGSVAGLGKIGLGKTAAGLIAKGTEKAGVGFLGKELGTKGIGELAGAGAAKITGGIAAKYGEKALITQAARVGAGSAIEGLAMGTGQVISEAALGDPDLSFQHAAGIIGLNMAFGGGVGAFTKAGTMGIKTVLNSLKEATLPTATADVIGKAWAKVAPSIRGFSKEQTEIAQKGFGTAEGRQLLNDALQSPATLEVKALQNMKDLKTIGQKLEDITLDARSTLQGEAGKFTALNTKKSTLKNLNNSIDSAVGEIEHTPSLFNADAKNALTDFRKLLNEKFSSVTNKGEMHKSVQDIRIGIDALIRDWSKTLKLSKNSRTDKLLQQVRGTFADHLKDETIYGQFGKDYDVLNSALHKYYGIQKSFLKDFTVKRPNAQGVDELVISDSKIKAYLMKPEKGDKELGLNAFQEALDNLQKTADATGKTNPVLGEALGMKVQEAKQTIKNLTEQRGTAIIVNGMESYTGKSLMGSLAGYALGSATGLDPTGGILGGVIGSAISSPATMLKIMTRIENLGVAGLQRNQSVIANMLARPSIKTSSELVNKYVPRVSMAAVSSMLQQDEEKPIAKPTMLQFRQMLDENIQDKHKPVIHFTNNNPHMEEFTPGYVAAAANTMNRALSFLQSKMPQNTGMDINPESDLRMSKSQQQIFDTYLDAAFRPSRLHEELKSHRPDPRVVEAVQVVYPEMFADLQKEILNQATEGKLGYQQKLTLGRLFAVNTSPSMSKIQNLQNNFIQAEKQEAALAMKKNTISKLAEAGMTPTDRLQM
jgi:hypothetical protein